MKLYFDFWYYYSTEMLISQIEISIFTIVDAERSFVVYKVVEIVSLKSDTPNFHETRILILVSNENFDFTFRD